VLRCCVIAGIVALLRGPAVPAQRASIAMTFEPCTLAAPGLPVTVSGQCGRLAVPLDRSTNGGRRIELAIARVASPAKRPQPDPVFMLAGGPGQGARESYPAVAAAFRDVLRDRDVILVDQRGTGGSHALDCPAAESIAAIDSPDAVRRAATDCLASLDVPTQHFTTSAAVADLDDVRAALGAERVNLVGISYGTRVALEYVRRHPERTRAIVLDGVVPPTLALGADHGRNLRDALERQFALCARDSDCASRYPAPGQTLEALLASLRDKPQRVSYRDPSTDELRSGELTAERVAAVVRLYSYAPSLAALLPHALAEAAAGRPERLMAQSAIIEDLVGEQINLALQLSVTCTEDAPLLEREETPRELLLGEDFVAAVLSQCGVWPRGAMPADFHAPLAADTPALLLSGELDPVTPPRYGDEVATTLSRARHVVAPGQGHNVMNVGCLPRLIGQFLRSADAAALDVRCVERLAPTPPFGGAYGWEP
jgi:pimeloyl-ACP methyl ester carboxylesterase